MSHPMRNGLLRDQDFHGIRSRGWAADWLCQKRPVAMQASGGKGSMSARLELSGFRLEKLQSLFGSRDQTVIEQMEARLERAARTGMGLPADSEEGAVAVLRSALHEAINGGVPVPGLEAEFEPHATLAGWLAHHEQEHRRTDCDIKSDPLRDFWEQYGKLLGTAGRQLFGYLVEGRPLLGPRFRPGTALVYGYLTRSEAGRLLTCLERFTEKDWQAKGDWDEEDVEELISDFMEWLDELRSKKLDIWASIS
jgi:hypothetical protein